MIVVPVEKRIDWKRPPFVLIGIVLLNIIVFAFYQSGDGELVQEAVTVYDSQGLSQMELPAYRAYLRKTQPRAELDPDDPSLIWRMASDPGFRSFVEQHQRRYVKASQRSKWKRARTKLHAVTDKISVNALGLDPNNISIITLISHQFLHGGIDHLIGNLVFLILTGFAVEAALGSTRFLVYYLASGVGGGLMFSLFELGSGSASASLIGASGAISGVMAMYVMLFKLRKIEFFYWLFVFTGYFKAAAIIMLPAYILKEIAMLVFGEASNVAYLAHVGGFLVGALLVYLTQSISNTAIDEDYLDGAEDQDDPFSSDLQKLYSVIGRAEFRQAWKTLGSLRKQRPHDPRLIEIEFNLITALNATKSEAYLLQRLGKAGNSHAMVRAQLESWNRMNEGAQQALSFEQKGGLLEAALAVNRADLSEKIFALMQSDEGRESELSMFARKIGVAFKELGRDQKARDFDQRARDFLQTRFSGGAA